MVGWRQVTLMSWIPEPPKTAEAVAAVAISVTACKFDTPALVNL